MHSFSFAVRIFLLVSIRRLHSLASRVNGDIDKRELQSSPIMTVYFKTYFKQLVPNFIVVVHSVSKLLPACMVNADIMTVVSKDTESLTVQLEGKIRCR